MMKCVLGFILLFHLCHSLTATFEVNGEIIRGLGELDTLYKNKSLILPKGMKSPTHAMHLKKHSCLGVCIKELTHILENVTLVDEKDRPILKKLNGTLVKLMDSHGKVSQNVDNCTMTSKPRKTRPFYPYKLFFQTLNSNSQ